MPRVVGWKKMACGAFLRTIVVTTTREEVVQRINAVPTFRHKRFIAEQWRKENDTI